MLSSSRVELLKRFLFTALFGAVSSWAAEPDSSHPVVVANAGLHVAVSDFEGLPKKLELFQAEEFDVGAGSLRRIHQILELESLPFTLIYGGDVGDRGMATRATFRFWIKAKDAHPDQVVLIAGNRDLNKLRLLTSAVNLEGDALVEKIKFIFSNKLPESKMGAPGAFEFRRQELGAEQSGAVIGDLEVAQSFVDEVKPGGLVWEYLIRAQLGYYTAERATIFAHGAVPWNTKLVVPAIDGIGEREEFEDLYKGIDALNARYRQALGSEAGRRALNEYCRPPAGEINNPESLVYNRMQNRSGIVALPPLVDTSTPLKRAVVFHTPQGEVGAGFINDAGQELWVLDNSGELELAPPIAFVDDGGRSYWKGQLVSGESVRFDSPLSGGVEDPYLGTYVRLLDAEDKSRSYLVTGLVVGKGGYVLTRVGEHYEVETRLLQPRAFVAALRSECESRSTVSRNTKDGSQSALGHMGF